MMDNTTNSESEQAILAKAHDGLSDYAAKMAAKAYRIVDESLPASPTIQDLIDVSAKLEQQMDNQVFRFAGKLEVLHMRGLSPEIACKKGCAYCCGTQITATLPEVFRLAKWIIENFEEKQIAQLKERLAEFVPKAASYIGSSEPRPPMDCPILVDNSCSAYPARPVACRGANSVDVEACIHARENWQDESASIPLVGQPYYAGKSMAKGLRLAMQERGLTSPIVEMPIALAILLDNPDAADQYLAGEPAFESSVIEL